MKLENLYYSNKSRKKRKRIGRGQGSGKGGTSTRGHNGAKSRSGFSKKIGFEGGQLPLQRRIPKFGFKKYTRKTYFCLNIKLIQAYVKNKILFKEITPSVIKKISFIWISKQKLIKILGFGVISSDLKVSAHKFSKSSVKSIKNAGGEVIHIL